MEFAEHPWKFARRHVKEGGVGKDAVEMGCRQFEREKILLPHFGTGRARHCGEPGRAIEPDWYVTECGECLEIASGPAAQIENSERR